MWLRRTASSALLAGLCLNLSAQTDSLHRRLDKVEVTATAASRDAKAANPTFTLTKAKMTAAGVTDISDALHRLPGLNIRDYGGAGGMKTVSVRGLGATHTGVIYDGVSLSDCQSGQIDLSRYSLDNVGSLQAVIGDGSSIFVPARATAAAANIVIDTHPVPDADDPTAHVTAQFKTGSWGLANPYVSVGKSFGGRLSISATGEYTYADNDYPFTLRNGKLVTRERRTNSRISSGHGEMNLVYRFSSRSQLSAKAYYYDNDRHLPGAVVLYNPESHESLRERNAFGQMTWRLLSAGEFSMKFTGKFNWEASLYHDENGKYPGGVKDEDYWQREAYLTGALLWRHGDHWEADYSADYFYNNLTSNEPNQNRPYRHSVLQTLYGRYRSDRLLVTAGILASIYDNGARSGETAADARKLSPSVNLSVQPFAGSMLFVRAGYKNIFRMPTFNDSYYFRMGNTGLKPESTEQVNLGLTWQAPARGLLASATLTGDIYLNHVKDKIVAMPQNMVIWTMVNLDKVRAFGADLTADVALSPARSHTVTLTGNYSYQRVQPRTSPNDPDWNKQVAYTPRHSGALSLGWENPWVNATLHATGTSCRYGTSTNIPATRIGGYIDCGFALYRTLTFGRNRLTLRADILNILDKQYEVVARYPMPGRSWRATVTYTL